MMHEVTSQPHALQRVGLLPASVLGREARAATYRERQLPLSAVDADWRAMTPEQRQDHPAIAIRGDRPLMQHLALGAAALHYAVHGMSVFPLVPRGKKPLNAGGRGYLDASADPRQAEAWWSLTPDANIGLVPGLSGLVIIDIDGPEGEEHARRFGLHGTKTLSVRTGRAECGQHLYFRHPGFPVSNRSLAPHLDVRGDRGYVLVPPSVHPTGRRYEWNGETEIAPLPRAVLDALRGCPEPDLEPTEWHAPSSVDRAVLGYRIGRYLATVGNCTEGSRNSTAFRVAAMLVRDFALTTDLAWPYLVSWNAKNVPPLPTRELRDCLGSAMRHGRRSVGSGFERESRAARGASHAPVGYGAGYGKRYGKRFGGGYGRRQ